MAKKKESKGKKEKKKRPARKVNTYYEVSGDKLTRKKSSCPKCGPSIFLARHKDRSSCGACGYTEFSKK